MSSAVLTGIPPPSSPPPLPSPQPQRNSSVTHVQATLDLSFKHKQSNGPSSSSGGSELADTALDWESQYAAALQKGL